MTIAPCLACHMRLDMERRGVCSGRNPRVSLGKILMQRLRRDCSRSWHRSGEVGWWGRSNWAMIVRASAIKSIHCCDWDMQACRRRKRSIGRGVWRVRGVGCHLGKQGLMVCIEIHYSQNYAQTSHLHEESWSYDGLETGGWTWNQCVWHVNHERMWPANWIGSAWQQVQGVQSSPEIWVGYGLVMLRGCRIFRVPATDHWWRLLKRTIEIPRKN